MGVTDTIEAPASGTPVEEPRSATGPTWPGRSGW